MAPMAATFLLAPEVEEAAGAEVEAEVEALPLAAAEAVGLLALEAAEAAGVAALVTAAEEAAGAPITKKLVHLIAINETKCTYHQQQLEW